MHETYNNQLMEAVTYRLCHLYDLPHFTDARSERLVQGQQAIINQWNWERRLGHLIPIPELFQLHFPSNF